MIDKDIEKSFISTFSNIDLLKDIKSEAYREFNLLNS